MKKVLAWVLLLTLIVGAFAGCKKTDPVQVTEPSVTEPANTGKVAGANDAIEYLKGFYKDDGSQTPVDYTRFGIVRVGGVAFDVVWTVDVGEDLIKVIVNDDGTVTIDINEECPEDTEYTLTATVTDAQGNTVSHSWTHILPKAQDMVEIIKAAYALAPGESLPYESRLIGKIISIDTIWTDEYQNIGVTIEVTGAEDMPIKCYRMKANDTTIEIIKDLKVGNIITVRGILKNYEGIIEFDAGCILEKVEKGDAIDAPTDAGQILKEAYALAENKTLPYQATLTGTVTEIDTPYDPAYGNICVVIEVEGYPEYPILCYRLKGTGVDQIAIGDLITVTGIIKNYKGTIEYDAGCMMTNRVSGGGVAQGPSSDAAKILADAAKLNPGEKLPYRATLTGEITSVDTPYSSQYGNVTVTMKVNGVKIQCYRMVGDGIDQIRETDTITVSGVIENYNGKLEFGLKCNLDSWTKGPRNVNYGPVKEDVAYKMYMEQGALDKTLYFNGQISGNRMSTTTDGSKGADVFGERISGKGVRFYDMDGNTKTYIEIEEYTNNEGKQRGRALVTTTPSCYWVYDADTGVYAVNLPTAGKYFLGTYNTYETITASWLGYIDGTMNGSNQYVAKFIESDKVSSSTPSDTVVKGTPVEEPVVGTGYKFGFYQNQLDGKPFLAFAGKMSGFYAATSEVISGMVDVYLENADGGYYLYFMDGNTKTYIDIVERASDATKVDIALQTSGTHTVYQLNTEHNYVYTSVVGSEWYLGTFNQNNSISASKTSYISDTSKIGVSQFCAWFCTVEEVEGEPENPTEPEATEPEATEPSTGTTDMVTSIETGKAYKWGVEQKNVGKTLYFAGTTANQDYYLSTTEDMAAATDVYLEAADGGYYLYFMAADGTKTYVDLYLSANGYQNIRLVTEPSAVFTYDETYNTLVAPVEGNDCYIGAYKTFETFSCSKYSYISTSFPSHFYAEGEGSEPEATEPEATEPQPTTPVEPPVSGDGYNKITSAAEFTTGKYVMIVNTGYAPGAEASYWLAAVQPVVSGNTVTDTKGAEWTLTVTGNSVTLQDPNGKLIGPRGGNQNGLNIGSYDWAWSFEDGKFVFAGTGADTVYLASNTSTNGSTAGNHRFRGYKTSTVTSYPESYPYQFELYKLGGEYVEPEVTEPEATEPEATEPSTGTTGMVTAVEAGKAYKWGVEQKNVGKTLYFAGTTANQDYYLSTTEDMAAATDVYLEAADGGYYLYFMAADGTKTYVDLYLSANGYQNIRLVTEPSAVFTYDETYNTLVAPVEGNDCYIGAYKTFETFSCSKYSYISTSFPSHFYAEGEGSEPEATEPEGEVYDIVPGKNLTVALEHTAKIATVSFKYTMGEGTFNMALSTADGAAYYGYFAFDKHGNVDKYDGITVEKLSDNSYYVTIEIAELNKMTGDPKGDIAVFYLRGAWTDGNGTISELNITEETAEPEATEPAGDEFTVNYNFANCAKGPEQYVAETHELDDITTLDIVGCHMNTQLRIYQDAKYDGNAVFTCANAIKSLALNAGFKAASLEIYGSVDGTNWVLIDTLTTAVAYGDFVVDFPANTAYRYLKLDATGAQVRVANIAITFKN